MGTDVKLPPSEQGVRIALLRERFLDPEKRWTRAHTEELFNTLEDLLERSLSQAQEIEHLHEGLERIKRIGPLGVNTYPECYRRMHAIAEETLSGAPSGTAAPQAPVARVTVRESLAGHNAPDDVSVTLYAPGLPPGEHDLYCEPGLGPSARIALLERIAELATELCNSVDCESEDVGGVRPSLTILREIGPLTDRLEKTAGRDTTKTPVEKPTSETIRRVCEGRASYQEGAQVNDYIRHLEGELQGNERGAGGAGKEAKAVG